MIQGFYLFWAAFVQHPHLNQLSPSLNKQVVLPYLYQLSLIVLGYCLSSLSPLHHITHTRASLALGLMDLFPEFEYLLPMPPNIHIVLTPVTHYLKYKRTGPSPIHDIVIICHCRFLLLLS